MELRIRDKNMIINEEFGWWLVSKIKIKLISNMHKYKFDNWDKYLNESDSISRLYKKKYNTKSIILFAASNLVCDGGSGEISIHFDTVKFVPGFDRLKLNIIVKAINYGTLDIKSCPIFTDTLNYFSDNIDMYVTEYYGLEV